MAVTEQARHDLHTRLEQALGAQDATTLMSLLPPVGWADVATKHDLVLLKQDIVALKQDLVALEERIGLRIEASEQRLLATFRQEIGHEIATFRQEIGHEIGTFRQEMGTLRHEVGTLRKEMGTQTRTFVLATLGGQGLVATVAFAAARLV